jgi:8-oxo-dGTP diphosphatase
MKHIIASGPVIIEQGNLLVVKEDKDNFYKLPGGTVEQGEDLEETCHREVKEEIGGEIDIIKALSPDILWKNPRTDEEMCVVLIHYLAELKNKGEIKPIPPIKEILWLDVEEIRSGKHKVSPNIQFLIDKGDI